MALIALAAAKGSPGVTTAALLVGGLWPRRALVAECDPAGGDLVYRLPHEGGGPLDPNLGLLSLAAESRHSLDAAQVWPHCQLLPGGLEVLLGLATAEQATGLGPLWLGLGPALATLPEADVLADLGRLTPDSPTVPVLAHAAAVVLVARATPDQVAHARDRAAALAARLDRKGAAGPAISLLLIADERAAKQAREQVTALLRTQQRPVDVVGVLADDARGAALIGGGRPAPWRQRSERSLLVRSAREVTALLARRVERLSPVAG